MSKIDDRGQGMLEDVVATITWEQLRELAGFRAEKGCAVSLYLSLDPSEAPTAAAIETKSHSLLAEAARLLDERKGSLGREQREALKADIERIGNWFDDGFDRAGARGTAIFAAGLDNFWSILDLPDPVADEIRIGAELYVAPLVRLVGRADGVLVAVVGRERGEVYALRDGQLVAIADESEEVPGQHDQGGWSQARYERHIDEIVERHWRRVAQTLDGCVREHHGVRVVLVGADDVRSDFEGIVSREVKGCLAGWTTADAHADARELLAAVRPVLEAWWSTRETDLLERWRQEAGKHGRATTGWEQTLEAASDGRVELLLVQDGIDQLAYQCPACGRVQMTHGSCPLDGTTLESNAGGLDLAVHQTLAHGGTVHVVRGRQDLEPVGGVGALLRY